MLERFPWLIVVPRVLFRMMQARYTAGVVGVVRNYNNEILLVKHVYHPHTPWGLPGGWLGRREHPSVGLKRELREETGIEVSVRATLIVDNDYIEHHLDMAFLCDAHNDVIELSEELLEYQWLDPNELPRLLPFHHAAVQEYLNIRQYYARSESSIS